MTVVRSSSGGVVFFRFYGWRRVCVEACRMTSLRRRVQGNAPGGSYCPRRRRASRLDESVVQEVLGAKPAMHHLLVTEPTALALAGASLRFFCRRWRCQLDFEQSVISVCLSVCLFQQHFWRKCIDFLLRSGTEAEYCDELVCLPANISLDPHMTCPIFTKFLCLLYGRGSDLLSSSGGVAIRFVLRMTSYLQICLMTMNTRYGKGYTQSDSAGSSSIWHRDEHLNWLTRGQHRTGTV